MSLISQSESHASEPRAGYFLSFYDATVKHFRLNLYLNQKDLINTWETTISKLKERDDELVQEEMKNVDVKEELIAREQIIKGTA